MSNNSTHVHILWQMYNMLYEKQLKVLYMAKRLINVMPCSFNTRGISSFCTLCRPRNMVCLHPYHTACYILEDSMVINNLVYMVSAWNQRPYGTKQKIWCTLFPSDHLHEFYNVVVSSTKLLVLLFLSFYKMCVGCVLHHLKHPLSSFVSALNNTIVFWIALIPTIFYYKFRLWNDLPAGYACLSYSIFCSRTSQNHHSPWLIKYTSLWASFPWGFLFSYAKNQRDLISFTRQETRKIGLFPC